MIKTKVILLLLLLAVGCETNSQRVEIDKWKEANHLDTPLGFAMFVSQELRGSGFSEGSTATDIVRLSLKTGNIEEPLAMIPLLKHGSDKIACLSIIAATVAKQRRFKKLDELVEIAESLESTIRIPTTGEVRIVSLRQGALHAIAVAIAVEGTLTRALNVASTIEDDYYKIEALTEISKALIAAGENKLALASLQQGPQIVKEMPAGGGIDKKQSRFTLSLALCNAGGVDQALLLAEQMRAPTDKSRVLTAIARRLFESGDRQQSLTLLTQSSKLAKQVNDDLFKSMVVPDIAFLFADHGDFSQALASAAQLDDPSTRFEILSRKATALAAMGELEEALKAARAIPEPGNAVGQIAVALAGKEEFTKALDLANTIENKYEKASALVDIASALIVAEQFEQALSALDRLAASNLSTFGETWYLISSLAESGQLKLAHEIASRTNVDHQKVLALLVIAVGQAQTPDNEQALQTLQQALDTANKLEDSHNTSAGWLKIASVQLQFGHPKKALASAQRAEGAVKASAKYKQESILSDVTFLRIVATDRPGSLSVLKQALDKTRLNPDAKERRVNVARLGIALATEFDPDQNRSPDDHALSKRVLSDVAVPLRIRKSFSAAEQQFALELLDVFQADGPG